MNAIVQYLLSGLAMGGIYALVGLGFYIMWSAAKAVNFAHGDTLMLGGVLTIVAVNVGIWMPFGILFAVFVTVAFGLAIERIGVRPFARYSGSIGWMLTTIAIGIMLETYVTVSFGAFARPMWSPMMERPLMIMGAGIYPQELFIIAFALVFVVFLELFYRRTQLGRALRAVAFNREASGMMGINVPRITAFAFGLAGGLGGVAGVLIGPVTSVSATMGLLIGLKGFVVFIMAGISSAYGVVAVGLAFGVIEKFVEGFGSTTAREIVVFSLAIVVLLLYPQGLFGQKDVVKV